MKYIPFFLLFTLSLNAQTPDKVSIYQPDEVKLNTKRKPPLTVGECIGFLQANAPEVFQFRAMMGADTIRTRVEIRDTVRRLVEVFSFTSADTTPAKPDPVDGWAFLSPTTPVTYSTPKVRYVRIHDTIYKTVYRDFLMHRDTIYQPCQDSLKASTFEGGILLWAVPTAIMLLFFLIVLAALWYGYKTYRNIRR